MIENRKANRDIAQPRTGHACEWDAAIALHRAPQMVGVGSNEVSVRNGKSCAG